MATVVQRSPEAYRKLVLLGLQRGFAINASAMELNNDGAVRAGYRGTGGTLNASHLTAPSPTAPCPHIDGTELFADCSAAWTIHDSLVRSSLATLENHALAGEAMQGCLQDWLPLIAWS